tara:strand:+ start:46 stop:1320 length:1275 start_codon:yes stop_codon:yes gene_type:complete
MRNFLEKIFLKSNNLDYISKKIKNLTNSTPVIQIFEAINSYSLESEIRYVGGCIRKIIKREEVEDIDLATNLQPEQVCEILQNKKIKFFETGLEHGTISAIIDNFKFEITSLREDIFTDGRHAKVKFSQNWKEDALRRDFTINSIYSDKDGNLFDPFNGKSDLEKGLIKFIGDVNQRINEDYLRILRYLRFFLNYSKHTHNPDVIRKIRMNLDGVSNLSKDRLLDELQKFCKIEILEKLSKDKISLEIILSIFPELKNINIFSKLSLDKKRILDKSDFIFLLSLMIIDNTDNTDYFLYKYNISKINRKRIENIKNFFNEKINTNSFSEKNLNKIFYYHGRQAVLDILNLKIIKTQKLDQSALNMLETFETKDIPVMPIGARNLMTKYKIPEGKQLGSKLKIIEEKWVNNNFRISDIQVEQIIKN